MKDLIQKEKLRQEHTQALRLSNESTKRERNAKTSIKNQVQQKIDKYERVRDFIQSCIVVDAKPEHNFVFQCRLDDCNQFIADLKQILQSL